MNSEGVELKVDKQTTEIGLVIVVYNQKEFMNDLFTSLCLQSFKDFTLYLVDNNSYDGSLDTMKKLNENNSLKVKYIQLNENTGFAAGSNTGAKEAANDGCKYLFILNNDVFLNSTCLYELNTLLENNEEALAAGPLILRDKNITPDIVQEFGGKINFKSGSVNKYFTGQNMKDIKLPEISETEFISGGACFIRTDVFIKSGMFEEKYFAYFDEIDLYNRMKKMLSGKMYVTSKAILWHNHKWIKDNKNSYYFEYYLTERNKFLYFHKFKLYSSILIAIIVDSIKFPWRMFWFIKVCDLKLGIYYLKGMVAGIFNKTGKPKFEFIS